MSYSSTLHTPFPLCVYDLPRYGYKVPCIIVYPFLQQLDLILTHSSLYWIHSKMLMMMMMMDERNE